MITLIDEVEINKINAALISIKNEIEKMQIEIDKLKEQIAQ